MKKADAFLTPGSGMGKKSGSGSNNPDHIFESLETSFWVKILKFFVANPGWFGSGNVHFFPMLRIRDKHSESAILEKSEHSVKLQISWTGDNFCTLLPKCKETRPPPTPPRDVRDGKYFFIYFLAGSGVLATPMFMSPILYFLRDVWIRTQRAAVASRRANNLATYISCGEDLPMASCVLFMSLCQTVVPPSTVLR